MDDKTMAIIRALLGEQAAPMGQFGRLPSGGPDLSAFQQLPSTGGRYAMPVGNTMSTNTSLPGGPAMGGTVAGLPADRVAAARRGGGEAARMQMAAGDDGSSYGIGRERMQALLAQKGRKL
jgi:hypothetical protein